MLFMSLNVCIVYYDNPQKHLNDHLIYFTLLALRIIWESFIEWLLRKIKKLSMEYKDLDGKFLPNYFNYWYKGNVICVPFQMMSLVSIRIFSEL